MRTGDVPVEEAAEHLYDHGIPAYAYATEKPVAVLGARRGSDHLRRMRR